MTPFQYSNLLESPCSLSQLTQWPAFFSYQVTCELSGFVEK